MERFSPKIEIINHFDKLINRIDIDIESSIEKFNDKQILSKLIRSLADNKRYFGEISNNFNVEFFHKTKSSPVRLLSVNQTQ